MFTAEDRRHMVRALELARRGLYTTTPNPRVGCVVVRDGNVVGEGWHERAGSAHAEVNALGCAGAAARGATLYVSLEPCSHYGRTPPCTSALASSGVARVVAAMRDPNPEVAGRGFRLLEEAGIAVEHGLLEDEARELNIGFVARMTRGWPWIRMKIAASLDGKTALENGQSRWITGAASRRDGHAWRARSCAVLTGIGTVRDDDPQLTVREVETPRQPLRVVVDSRLETPLDARVLQGGGALIAAATDDVRRSEALRSRGAEVVVMPNARGKVELGALMKELGRREMNEVHVEAGYKLNGSLLQEGLVDELVIYLAPSVIGDRARGMFDFPALETLSGRRGLRICEVTTIDSDIRVIARPA
jgi:diaminohydroxyphosphoribosylaminopyrimidine deaminase / 5-amino-6-(5-phosphoribosylamino)uracil reductase